MHEITPVAGNMFFSFFSIIGLLIYILPVLFIVWFLIKYIKIQERKNEILQSIAEKLNDK
ncbi:hypothetical protein DV702_05550 [Sporosarcina sp. PTS2304]|uniref:hypothetical protein n=1 Tax=Sporosarcina sp. PTS2304 TaxID=2283194 RepID=UPI000E0DD0A9|nr:hypothetical protein [Sporosarcina sp. PTS2304]AXH99251.1 hypothetical protein DV702_05550 [Sporosarcina sp. PTS2304]